MKSLRRFEASREEQGDSCKDEHSHAKGESKYHDDVELVAVFLLLGVRVSPLLSVVVSSDVAKDEGKHRKLDSEYDAAAASWSENSLVGIKSYHNVLVLFFACYATLCNMGIKDVLLLLPV